MVDKIFFFIFCICIGFVPGFITFFGDKALQIPFTVIAVVSGFLVLLRPALRRSFFLNLVKPIFLLLTSFCMMLGVYAFFGIFDDHVQIRIIQKLTVVILLVILLNYIQLNFDKFDYEKIIRYLFFGISFGLLVITVETIWGYQYLGEGPGIEHRMYRFFHINKLNRSLEVISILVFLIGLGTCNRLNVFRCTLGLIIYTWVLSLVVLGALQTPKGWFYSVHVSSETVLFGIPAAFVVFILAQRFPRFITDVVFGSVCFIFLAAPWLYQFLYAFLTSEIVPKIHILLVRAEIWDGVSRKIIEAPYFGYGIDSAKYLNHIDIAHTYYYKPSRIWHPHNMFLQIWLDMGLLGVSLICSLIILGWIYVRNLEAPKCPPVIASISMLFLFCLVSHSVWQTWSMALLAIVIIIVSIVPSRSQVSRRLSR